MAGQVGWKTETTVGTAVVPDTFAPVLNADLAIDEGYMRPSGIRGGRVTRGIPQLGARTISGSVNMELPNKSIASLLKHLFGAVTTTGASSPYTHTYTPATAAGKSMTLQVGITDAAGVTQPFTLAGVKPNGWNLSCNVGEFAQLSFDHTAMSAVTATALAAASYAAGLTPFTFVQGSISVDGSPIASARSVTLSAAKNLKTDRHVIGSRNIREQLNQDLYDFTTEVTADFENLTLFNLIANATPVASVYQFSNGTDSLEITTNGIVVGDAPSLTNPGIEEQTIRLEHGSGTSDANTVTAVLINGEASAA